MTLSLHPEALIENGAILEDTVKVDKGAIVRKNVKIGEGTYIGPYSLIEGFTEIGSHCKIFSHAVIGSQPQDLKYQGRRSYLKIGNNNIIREFTTLNPGTVEDSTTIVGDNNLIMAYSHIAHNCLIGNNCILANAATLAGYVEIQDYAIIGGLVAVHQFTRVGFLSIVGGCSKVVQDVPPFSMCDGHPVQVRGLNLVGLKRRGYSKERIEVLKKAFKILFFSGFSFSSGFEELKKQNLITQDTRFLIDFIRSSKRGICRPR